MTRCTSNYLPLRTVRSAPWNPDLDDQSWPDRDDRRSQGSGSWPDVRVLERRRRACGGFGWSWSQRDDEFGLRRRSTHSAACRAGVLPLGMVSRRRGGVEDSDRRRAPLARRSRARAAGPCASPRDSPGSGTVGRRLLGTGRTASGDRRAPRQVQGDGLVEVDSKRPEHQARNKGPHDVPVPDCEALRR